MHELSRWISRTEARHVYTSTWQLMRLLLRRIFSAEMQNYGCLDLEDDGAARDRKQAESVYDRGDVVR